MTPEDVAKGALGIDWKDTESAARRVAEYASEMLTAQQDTIRSQAGAAGRMEEALVFLEANHDCSDVTTGPLVEWRAVKTVLRQDGAQG